MQYDSYSVEKNFEFEERTRKNMERLYLPLIGANSLTIYDFFTKQKSLMQNVNSFDQLISLLGISNKEFVNSRKKLEAVGLMKTFESKYFSRYVFKMVEPLNIETFKNNVLLYKTLISIIGQSKFENYYSENKLTSFDLTEYKDISVSFFSVFKSPESRSFKKEVDFFSQTTNEFVMPEYQNYDEYVNNLAANNFITYLTNKKPHPLHIQFITECYNNGFNDASINLIVAYTVKKTSKLPTNYLKKVKETLIRNRYITYEDVLSHFDWMDSEINLEMQNNEEISFNNFDDKDNELVKFDLNVFKKSVKNGYN